LALSLFFVPDKVSETSILTALKDKNELLKKTLSPKIILLGGSNVSFGMDSKKLEERYRMPVVNTGLHGGLGMEFMLNHARPYVQKGDVLILMPEYEYFYTNNFYGEMELVSVIFDVEPESKKIISNDQWSHLLKYLPTYSAKKIKNYASSLFQKSATVVDIYHRNSFNKYGDACLHWDLPNQNYLPAPPLKGNEKVNSESIQFLKEFKLYVKNRGAALLIFPPVIDKTSFDNQKIIIEKIAEELKNNDLTFFTKPSAYRYEDSLFFNSYYHLNKKGVDKRTEQLIRDLD
jgi:hypothetical protein